MVPSQRPRHASDNQSLLKQLALQGMGIALLPAFACADELAGGSLVEVLRPKRPGTSPLYLAFPGRATTPPAVRAFADHLFNVFAPRPPKRARGGSGGSARRA